MEGESAVEQALSSDFNYDHFLSNQNFQASPINVVGKFSNEVGFDGELGSSCGSNELIMNQQNNNIKKNLTASSILNREILEVKEDSVASLMETPQNIWDNGIGIIPPWMNQDHPHSISMPLIPPLRSQLPNQLQLNNEVFPALTNVSEHQLSNNSMPIVGPSTRPGLDQLDDCYYHQQTKPVQTRTNIFDMQNCNNSRLETNQPQVLPQQNGGSDLIDSYQQNTFLNSETHQNFLEKKRRFEVGESSYLSSSSSSKRFKLDELAWKNQVDWNADFSKFSNLRTIKSSVYDPLFEGIGLPIDPHLRMFSLRY